MKNNERNCIIYRKSEKVVLNFLKECADRLDEFSEMTMKHGTKWVNSWEIEETYKYQDYFYAICPLLPNKLSSTDWL